MLKKEKAESIRINFDKSIDKLADKNIGLRRYTIKGVRKVLKGYNKIVGLNKEVAKDFISSYKDDFLNKDYFVGMPFFMKKRVSKVLTKTYS